MRSHRMMTSPLCWASNTRGVLSLTEMKRALKLLKLHRICFYPSGVVRKNLSTNCSNYDYLIFYSFWTFEVDREGD